MRHYAPDVLDGISAGRARGNGAVLVLGHAARFELHGDVSIRMQTRQAFDQLGPTQSMTQAPLIVTAQGVDVTIVGAE
jgi:hypothetical protein